MAKRELIKPKGDARAATKAVARAEFHVIAIGASAGGLGRCAPHYRSIASKTVPPQLLWSFTLELFPATLRKS